MLRVVCLAIALLAPSATWSHGGGLDRCGGHHNRVEGGYHVHDQATFTRCPHRKVAALSVAVFRTFAGSPVVASIVMNNNSSLSYAAIDLTCLARSEARTLLNLETFDAGSLSGGDEVRFDVEIPTYGERGKWVQCWASQAEPR